MRLSKFGYERRIRRLRPFSRTRIRRLHRDPEVLRLARLIARERRVSLLTLVSASRGSMDAAMARHLAFYLSYVLLGRTYEEVGLLFARSRNTIQRSCSIIEDLRDDPLIDREIARLEQNMNIAKEEPDGR